MIDQLHKLNNLTAKERKQLLHIANKIPGDTQEYITLALDHGLKEGEHFGIIKKRIEPTNFLKPYTTIGGLNDMNTTHRTKKDLLDLLGDLKPATQQVFLEIKNARDPKNNHCFFDTKNYTPGQKKVVQRQISEIKKMSIIKRKKIGLFIINPYLIKPFDFDITAEWWNTH